MTDARPRLADVGYDTVVIGAGLAGLTAALRLAEAGQRVAILAKGVGATHLAPPTIDVLGYADGPVDSPAQALPKFAAANPEHPYRQLSIELLRASLDWFKARLGDHGYRGGLDENFFVPTAIGVAKPTALLPETMAAGDLRRGGRFVFVGLRGLKDFFPAYLAENVARAPVPGDASVTTRVVELAPPLGEARDVSSAGFARRFERADFRESVLAALGRNVVPGELVGFPAGLELDFSGQVREPVFDLPLAGLPGQNEPRFATDYFDEHALSRAGVAVDASRRPVNLEGAPVYENLYAAGATLAGAVPWREGSGNGLSLASGYAAASAILEATS